MTREEIAAVMEKVPLLNDFGIGLYRDGSQIRTKQEREEEMQKNREQLLNSAEICTKVCEWLADKRKIKSISDGSSSYGLKHIAEHDLDEYVSNGVFIAAAIHCGFPYRVRAPNVMFGISRRGLYRRKGQGD